MPNKKINQLDARVGAALTDLILIGDPTSGTSYKLTATDFKTLLNSVPYTGATTNVNLGEYGISAGYFQADLTPTLTGGIGRLIWNDTDGTLDLGLKGGNVTLQIGQEQVQRVVNKSGADLLESAYQVVKVINAQGQRLAVDLAQGNNDLNSADTLGIVTENISNNQEGFITTSGLVRGINTTGSLQGETWADGDILYLSPTTAGAITKVKPTAPQHSVILGYVVYAHANNGKIYTKIDNGYEVGELHDCYLPTPSNNDGIFWNTANSRYQNNTIAGALGYTPVPTTRTLTINGTAYDLSADRSWTVSASATPAGSNTQLQYNNSGVFGASANLVWDNANARLGIGETTPEGEIHIKKSNPKLIVHTNSSTGYADLNISTNPATGANFYLRQYGSGVAGSVFGYSVANTSLILQNDGNALLVGTYKSIPLILGTNNTERARITSAGRLLLGTTTESTYLLDVNGTARIGFSVGGSSTGFQILSTTYNQSIFKIVGTGEILIGNSTFEAPRFGAFNTSATLNLDGSNVGFYSIGNNTGTTTNGGFFNVTGLTSTISSNHINNVLFLRNFAPTSGTGTFNNLQITSTINQTGGANGITRGLFINPTITAAADWRGVEVSIGGGYFNTTSVSSSAILQADSTTKGFLPPRMTTTQRDAIATPATGLQIYNTTTNENNTYNGTAWVAAGGGGTPAGSNTQIQYNNSGVFGASSSFTYTDSTGTVNLTKSIPIVGLEFIINNTSNTGNAASAFVAKNAAGNIASFGKVGAGYSYKMFSAGDGVVYTQGGNLSLFCDTGSFMKFGSGGTSTAQMTLTSAGRLLLGTTTESTYLLDVNGTARVSGNLRVNSGSNINWDNVSTSQNRILFYDGGSTSTRAGFGMASGLMPIFAYSGNSIGFYDGVDATNFNTVTSNFTITPQGPTIGGTKTLKFDNTTNANRIILFDNGTTSTRIGFGTFNGGSVYFEYLDAVTRFGGGVDATTSTNANSTMWLNHATKSVNIGPSTNVASSKLTIESTTQGFLPPRMTNAQRSAISSPAVGLIVYCTDAVEGLYIYKSTGWTFVI